MLGLDRVREEARGDLAIGALCTLNSISNNALVCGRYPVLRDTIVEIASEQVRNRATVGGNLCNASPAADMAPALMALGARLSVSGVKKNRKLALADFFLEPRKTALMPGEIVTDVLLPPCPEFSATVYLKHKRNAMDCSVVGVAVCLVLQDTQTCSEARVILGAVGPTPLDARRAADLLCGNRINQETIDLAADLATEEARPRDDIRASAWYRKKLVRILTVRAIQQAYAQVNTKLKK
jgi:carbon-monoxide dehydrogenase medium subunit